MNQAVKTGLVTGAISVACMIGVIYVPRGNATAIFQYASFLVFLSGAYVAIKRTRDHEMDGHIEFKLGLKAGVSGGSVAALMISIFQFIAWTHIDLKEFTGELKIHGASDSEIMAQLRGVTRGNFFRGASMLCATNIILSLFVSIAASLILRKKGGLLNQ
ncbi:MAG: DUF4199 domain-containing protein [Bacteroidetes bacterium]|nr:DUF4199 domain-containing protein [Bacteroidota bacterium]